MSNEILAALTHLGRCDNYRWSSELSIAWILYRNPDKCCLQDWVGSFCRHRWVCSSRTGSWDRCHTVTTCFQCSAMRIGETWRLLPQMGRKVFSGIKYGAMVVLMYSPSWFWYFYPNFVKLHRMGRSRGELRGGFTWHTQLTQPKKQIGVNSTPWRQDILL